MHIELSPEQLDQLDQAVYDDDGEGLRTGYSGRGMFGRQCIGYVGDNPIRFAFELAVILAIAESEEPDIAVDEHEIREVIDRIGAPHSDNMGRTTIWYWPNIRATSTD